MPSFKEKYKDFINPQSKVIYYPFSLPSLNRVVGGKGLRSGRFHQFIGEKSTGKTTLALDIVANAQKVYGAQCMFLDLERTFDPEYAAFLGVDLARLDIIKTRYVEDGLNIVEAGLDDGYKVIIVDSVPAGVVKAEQEKDLTESEKMAASAGLITRWTKRMLAPLDDNGAICILINQLRSNISTMSRKETKPFGAKAVQYYSSATLELARIKNGEDESIVQVFVEKNKQGGKEREKAEITMIYGQGLDYAGDVLRNAVEQGIVENNGAWYYYPNKANPTHRAQGLANAREMLPIEEIASKL